MLKKHKCRLCGWVYDPVKGDEKGHIIPMTAFDDLPDDWKCPICKAGKNYFIAQSGF